MRGSKTEVQDEKPVGRAQPDISLRFVGRCPTYRLMGWQFQ